MEVSKNMSQEEVLAVASSSHFKGRSRRVPTGNDLMIPTTRFKQCKVSAVRDFLPVCSRVAKLQLADLVK
ncbi:hypothetical protein J1N35_023090 [Gossypium stocksii]|uniref:Uncharacterized protein n=1 Tax=Gossypium stocksii TaxID=47602 RepID=A0A9D3VJK9_9ROSI|nr:hypothetical protein J1N35_023090 [Gossypium stocksii]